MTDSLLSAWLLGLVLGVRHAFEPDHLAAMATLVSPELGETRTPGRTALVGALWGVGHAATLLLVGGALVLCRVRMPTPLATSFEIAVAALLLFLGARSLLAAARHRHSHGGHVDHVHLGPRILPRRPFLVGVAHGLAGSGALTALALASMPSLTTALVYLLLFGMGSVAAMALASGLLGFPLERFSRSPTAQAALSSLAGVLSLVTGLLWGWHSIFG